MPATLTSLRIQNLALVENLDWRLAPGFTAVTGETGSGKSIIVGALKLVLGERADRTLIRSGADGCAVEAVFEAGDARAWLDERLAAHGIDGCADGQLILKRTLARDGAGRQFINCCATTLAALKAVGDALVDLHGPHDHQSLLATDRQLALLDAYAGADDLRRDYGAAYREWRGVIARREELAADDAARGREVDLLRHQVREIEAAAIRPGEEEEIEARYVTARHGRRLAELVGQLTARLAEADGSVLAGVAETGRLLRELGRLDPRAVAPGEAHAAVAEQLAELARWLQSYAAGLDLDPAQVAAVEERINLFEGLKRKYGPRLVDVVAFGETAAARLRQIESRDDALARLAAAAAAAEARVRERGGQLAAKRRAGAKRLARAVVKELHGLGFLRAGFEVVPATLAAPGPAGLEAVEFLWAPNPGEPPKPLRAVASSGEMSRVMLAVKSVLAAADDVPLLVFDEIDANVGGAVAGAVAARMRALAAGRQVLCVTHLPPVAAAARQQFVVDKEFVGGRTLSRLVPVAGEERVAEIARMLGGLTPSAVGHARALLADGD